jgi:hypothetical protein
MKKRPLRNSFSNSDNIDKKKSSENLSDMYSESDYTESSMTETGQFDSQHSLIKLKDRSNDKHTISLNMYIQMEYCAGDNL